MTTRKRLWPWQTLSGRLALAAVGGLLVASLVFIAVAVSLIKSQSLRNERNRLDDQARGLASVYSKQVRNAGRKQDKTLCRIDLSNLLELGGRGTLIGIDLLQGATCPIGVKGELPPEILSQVDSTIQPGEVQRLTVQLGDGGTTYLASAAPLSIGGLTVGSLVIARPRAQVSSAWQDILPRVLLAAAAGLTIALLLVTALSRRVTRPLRLLARATQRVAEGDRSITMGHAGTAEIDRVAESFNRMVGELAERDRLARDFLMRVTHDLRTPLTAIRGHAAALADGIVPEENVARSLGAIESEAGRLENLVADLLDLAKMEADRIRLDIDEVDPAEVVAQVCDLNQSVAAEREIRLERQLRPGLMLHTDSARVGQIVANLVDNALRWTPRGGLVTVLLRSGTGVGARVDVLDTGPGVPEQERETIFEAFRSTVTPDGEHGTGLGLATSRQLARALGGDLIVSDGPGGGSMFRLTLPVIAPAT